uniref:Uncharacterized protein n=1 Tax=Arundo donax TaxID=35708 RepID=A0A0A9C511_ARUDO
MVCASPSSHLSVFKVPPELSHRLDSDRCAPLKVLNTQCKRNQKAGHVATLFPV